MNKIAEFLGKHDFFDPRPFFWDLAMLAYLVDTILFAAPFSIPYPASIYTDLASTLTAVPGFIYVLGEFGKVVDRQDSNFVRVRNLMWLCLISWGFFGGVLRSLNNMAVSVGRQFPSYVTLRYIGRIVIPIATFVLGVCAVLIRRKLPFSPFRVQEEEPAHVPVRRSPAWILEAVGLMLILFSFPLGFFDVVALEALILLVSGLILFPTGFLIQKLTRPKPPTSPPP